MVTITDFKTRKKGGGETFNVLIVQGGAEVHRSQATGKNIINSRKASVITSLDDDECRNLIGSKLPGTIDKVPVDEYLYQIPGTTDIVMLKHSFEYNPEPTVMDEALLVEVGK